MLAVRRSGSRPELALRSQLHRRGLRFRVNGAPVPDIRSRADILFSRFRVAVYVDGCFWHLCPEHGRIPKANRDYWGPKLARNVERDRATDRSLAEAGWKVLRFYEHVPPEKAANIVQAEIARRLRVAA